MSSLYIFGDSFSTNYNSDYSNNGYALDYYNQEIKNGYVGNYKDLQYYLSKYLNIDDIINTAKPGCSNSFIFNNFSNNMFNFVEGDYVSFQTSFITRDFIYKNNAHTIIEYNDIEKTYLENTISFIKMVRNVCILSKVNFHIWTIDSRINNVSTIYDTINDKLSVKKKYKHLKDFHPSFEGYDFIANKIINNWETNDNYIKQKKKII